MAVRDLAAASTLNEVVEIVRHAARQLVNADGATFVLRDSGQCYYVDEDAIEPLWRGQRFPLEACISGWAMLNKQAVFIPDIYLDDRIPHEAYRPTFVQSLAMTPVRSADPIASIGTYWANRHVISQEETELLQALADSTAVALENARIRSELEDRVVQRTAELSAANNDLQAFVQLAAHDLRSPLLTVRGFTDLALAFERDNLSPEGLESLEMVRTQVERMRHLIDAILEYSTAATAEISVSRTDFDDIASRVIVDLHGLIDQRNASVTMKDLPTARVSGPMMERVLQNLIANAIQYGDADAPRVEVDGGLDDDGSPFISVSDNGQGVSDADLAVIFSMFKRGTAANLAEGSGIGLAFVERVVAKHGGSVSVDEGPLGGARFTVRLPR
ncbi:MAG: GAF domain-containing sensor histidine kinase [Acidimicrobiales bacterium]|nr:GAF domain-containing sensor histidine kinase [Acidimicrobiales bacterium]